MARALDHHLAAHFPPEFGQFAVNDHLRHLRPVMAVMNCTGPNAIAKRQHRIIFFHQITDPVELLIQRVFTLMIFHPGDHKGSAF